MQYLCDGHREGSIATPEQANATMEADMEPEKEITPVHEQMSSEVSMFDISTNL